MEEKEKGGKIPQHSDGGHPESSLSSERRGTLTFSFLLFFLVTGFKKTDEALALSSALDQRHVLSDIPYIDLDR